MTKKVLVIRYGAYGDAIIATPLYRRLKQDGWHITLNCNTRSLPVVRNNPNIDRILLQEDNIVPRDRLTEYWDAISRDYDRVINLSETLEVKFLTIPRNEDYHWPVEKRREAFGGTNYYDYVLWHAGYRDVEHPKGELFFDPLEEALAANLRKEFKDFFLILWCLSGSGMHKVWVRAAEAAMTVLSRHGDIVIITVGDYLSRLLEWEHPRTMSKAGDWSIRTAMLMTKYVDLVVSPETGILNAAGCFDTPKIGLLTHSNRTNLTKHFTNDHSIQAHIDCSPCHRLITMDNYRDCPLVGGGEENGGLNLCACADAFSPRKVVKIIEEVYYAWSAQRHSLVRPQTRPVVLYGPNGQEVLAPKRHPLQH